MSKWQDKSDFEINKAVATLKFKPSRIEQYGRSVYMEFHGISSLNQTFDGCNNPSDAWWIMKSHGICTLSEGGELVGAATDSYESYEPYGNIVHSVYDKNPLRAAMIVYLEMNGVKP